MSNKTDINLNKNSEDVLLNRYIEEISAYSPLSDEEEAELSIRIKEGDNAAKDRLVKANLRFVVSIARQYVTDGCSMLDLINEGNIALIHAAGNFDASRGQRFSSYAVWEIRKTIEAFLPKEDIRMNRTASEHLPGSNLDADSTIEEETDLTDICKRLRFLPLREQNVLRAYYGIGEAQLNMAEIGIKYNLRRERVRQIRNRALRRLHEYRNLAN